MTWCPHRCRHAAQSPAPSPAPSPAGSRPENRPDYHHRRRGHHRPPRRRGCRGLGGGAASPRGCPTSSDPPLGASGACPRGSRPDSRSDSRFCCRCGYSLPFLSQRRETPAPPVCWPVHEKKKQLVFFASAHVLGCPAEVKAARGVEHTLWHTINAQYVNHNPTVRSHTPTARQRLRLQSVAAFTSGRGSATASSAARRSLSNFPGPRPPSGNTTGPKVPSRMCQRSSDPSSFGLGPPPPATLPKGPRERESD